MLRLKLKAHVSKNNLEDTFSIGGSILQIERAERLYSWPSWPGEAWTPASSFMFWLMSLQTLQRHFGPAAGEMPRRRQQQQVQQLTDSWRHELGAACDGVPLYVVAALKLFPVRRRDEGHRHAVPPASGVRPGGEG